jgi:hypothetical protein
MLFKFIKKTKTSTLLTLKLTRVNDGKALERKRMRCAKKQTIEGLQMGTFLHCL